MYIKCNLFFSYSLVYKNYKILDEISIDTKLNFFVKNVFFSNINKIS